MRSLPLFDEPELRLPLEQIRENLGDCKRCKLSLYRNRIVFGQGDPKARIFLIGEAPGETEDANGIAFSGRAGLLLRDILGEAGIARDEVYISNTVKCRPPGNRDPQEDEVLSCRPFLEQQIASVRPRVIIALGGWATGWLTKEGKVAIAKIRGKLQYYKGIKFIPTFHPAYLLRNPKDAQKVLEDFRLAKTIAG